jgi:hypothetical protein
LPLSNFTVNLHSLLLKTASPKPASEVPECAESAVIRALGTP